MGNHVGDAMRHLLLFRHAKSSWDQPDLDDFDRPLAPRGKKAAPRVAAHLAERGPRPDLVLCSGAARTIQTWELAKEHLAGARVEVLESLYLAHPARIMDTVRKADEDARAIMVIGHNPGLEIFAQRIVGDGCARSAKTLAKKYPTAALAIFTIDCAWPNLDWEMGRLETFVRPADLE